MSDRWQQSLNSLHANIISSLIGCKHTSKDGREYHGNMVDIIIIIIITIIGKIMMQLFN